MYLDKVTPILQWAVSGRKPLELLAANAPGNWMMPGKGDQGGQQKLAALRCSFTITRENLAFYSLIFFLLML